MKTSNSISVSLSQGCYCGRKDFPEVKTWSVELNTQRELQKGFAGRGIGAGATDRQACLLFEARVYLRIADILEDRSLLELRFLLLPSKIFGNEL